MKMDGMMLDMIKGQMQKQSFLSDMCRDVTLVGSEKVSVPAGEFQAGHFRSDKYSSDTWVTAEVPFSMVKSTGKDFELTLAPARRRGEDFDHGEAHSHGRAPAQIAEEQAIRPRNRREMIIFGGI